MRWSFFLFLFLLGACDLFSQGDRDRSIKTENITTDPPPPPYTAEQPLYFTLGTNTSLSTLNLVSSFGSTFQLRGSRIHQEISDENDFNSVCFVAYFPSSTPHNLLVLKATPSQLLNADGQTEYYYLVDDSNVSANYAVCAGVINNLVSSFSGASVHSIVFKIDDLCPNCASTSSAQIGLMKSNGENFSYDTAHLSLNITPSIHNPGGGTGPLTCQVQSDCGSSECCYSGVCLSDTDPRCPNPTTTPPPNSQQLLSEKQELYECLNPNEAGVSFCTATHAQASVAVAGSVLGASFNTGFDDLNFSSTYSGQAGILGDSIVEISYGGTTLYNILSGNTSIIGNGISFNGPGNDSLTSAQDIQVTSAALAVVSNYADDNLKIKYKVNGTCSVVSTSMSTCHNFFIFNSDQGREDDYVPATSIAPYAFKLPSFADMTAPINVKVNQNNLTSNLITVSGNNVMINYAFSLNDKIDIEYAVTGVNAPVVAQSIQVAQDRINTLCNCQGYNCNLTPQVVNGVTNNYACDYSSTAPPTPAFPQNLSVPFRSAPVRFFADTGVPRDFYSGENITSATPLAEKSGVASFEYGITPPFLPNNIDQYIGFDEIFGGFSLYGAAPPITIDVEIGTSYLISTTSGIFPGCHNCPQGPNGSSYFPYIASGVFGGGYSPDLNSTNYNNSPLGNDDLLMGRACLVPATMLPWTHQKKSSSSTVQEQRQERMAGQHTLYANGYQKDWYGFDYGSLIGSFDGVHWFSVGNARRITATSQKLFLAVNTQFSDLINSLGAYDVHIEEDHSGAQGFYANNDDESSGAECRQVHSCNVDSDCAAKLGWDYVCEDISQVKSLWPEFDNSGNEILNAEKNIYLRNLFAQNSSLSAKRCVYRGRGTPCEGDYTAANPATSYSQTSSPRLATCSENHYCADITSAKFNRRIARLKQGASAQNADSAIVGALSATGTAIGQTDTFGFAARYLGRPLKFYGDESLPSSITSQLQHNTVSGLCLPGKDISSFTHQSYADLHQAVPSQESADRILGIGQTPGGNNARDNYLSSCSLFDTDGDYLRFRTDTSGSLNIPLLNAADTKTLARAQVIASNNLRAFITQLSAAPLADNTSQILGQTIQQNTCLRAPGATCHRDSDCAAPKVISDQISWTPALASIISEAEFNFWKNDLICAQEYAPTDSQFDLANNRCCRALGKDLMIATDQEAGAIISGVVSGIDIDIDNPQRYSAMAPMHLDSTLAPLQTPRHNDAVGTSYSFSPQDFLEQAATIHQVASKTCCTGHWVRKFSNGTHNWGGNLQNSISANVFKNLAWSGNTNGNTAFNCDPNTFNTADCEIIDFAPGSTHEAELLDFLGAIQLTGIPQIIVPMLYKEVDSNQNTISLTPIEQTLSPNASAEIIASGTGSLPYYSMADNNDFTASLQTVFSADEFKCCEKAGTPVNVNEIGNCCTGYAESDGGQYRCCLPNFTDVSLYLNAFVSSEGHDPIFLNNGALAHSETGYADTNDVATYFNINPNICCSGKMTKGRFLSTLPVPGDPSNEVRRPAYLTTDNSLPAGSTATQGPFNAYSDGVINNDHYYCVPDDNY